MNDKEIVMKLLASTYGLNQVTTETLTAYLLGETQTLPNGLIKIWIQNSNSLLDELYQKNPDFMEILKRFFTVLKKIDSLSLHRYMFNYKNRYFYFKETDTSEQFILENLVFHVDQFLECGYSYMLNLEDIFEEAEKYYPNVCNQLEQKCLTLTAKKQAVAFLFMAYKSTISCPSQQEVKKQLEEFIIPALLRRFYRLNSVKEVLIQYAPEINPDIIPAKAHMGTFTLPLRDFYMPVFFILCYKSSKIIEAYAKAATVLYPFAIINQKFNSYYKWRFDSPNAFYKYFSAPVEAILRFNLHQSCDIYNTETNTCFKNICDLLNENTEDFINCYHKMKSSRDLFAVGAFSYLVLKNKFSQEELDTEKKTINDLILSLIKEYHLNNNKFFVFPEDKEGEFSCLTQPDFTPSQLSINRNVFRNYDFYHNNFSRLAIACISLVDVLEIAKNIVYLFLDDMKIYEYQLQRLQLPHIYKYFHPDADILGDLYKAGLPFQLICLVNLVDYHFVVNDVMKAPEIFPPFLIQHKSEAENFLSNNELETNLLIRLMEVMYKTPNGFDGVCLVTLLNKKSKLVIDSAEKLLISMEKETRPHVEALTTLKSKPTSNAAMRLIRIWDNDKVEQEIKLLKDNSEFISYILARYGKSNLKNVPYADSIDYGNVRFLDSEEKIPADILKYYISEYILLKDLYLINTCHEIQIRANPFDLRNLIRNIYEMWINDNFPVKYRNILLPFALTAGSAQLDILKKQIDVWTENGKPGMAAFAVQCFILNGSKIALLMVDTMSKKHKNKKVKNAAVAALEIAMTEFNLSREDLEDLIVPDLGFDKNRVRIFNYGERQFKTILNPDLSITLYDGDKQIKSLPKASEKYHDSEEAAAAAKEEVKSIKKQGKTILDSQKLRISKAVFTGRSWSRDKWEVLFINNPLMFGFATGLVWSEISSEGDLLGTFRYMEDGTLNTVDEEEYSLHEGSSLALFHPADISEEEVVNAWRTQLEDYEIIQPVEQLNLPPFSLTQEEETKTELTRFKGIKIYGATVKSIAAKLSCPILFEEYGNICGFYYEFDKQNIRMCVETDSFYPSEYNTIVEIKKIEFIDSSHSAMRLSDVSKKTISFAVMAGSLLETKAISEEAAAKQ